MIQNVGMSWHAYVYQSLVHAEMLHKLVMFETSQRVEDVEARDMEQSVV
jgi:hypothetical protein